MKRLVLILLVAAAFAGCATRPTPPPECEGALTPINPPANAAAASGKRP